MKSLAYSFGIIIETNKSLKLQSFPASPSPKLSTVILNERQYTEGGINLGLILAQWLISYLPLVILFNLFGFDLFM